MTRSLPALLLALALLGCTGAPYGRGPRVPEAGQAYDLAVADCAASAQAVARGATATGERAPQRLAGPAFAACMAARGYAADTETIPASPESAPSSATAPPGMAGLGLPLPPGFTLLAQTSGPSGPGEAGTSARFELASPEGETRLIIVQERDTGAFTREPYPLPPGFFVYVRERFEARAGLADMLVFCGDRGGQWLLGLGAYVRQSDRRRVVVASVRPIAPPGERPPGLRLDYAQKAMAEAMLAAARNWIRRWRMQEAEGAATSGGPTAPATPE